MPREYTPDLWAIVQLTSEKGIHERVLASWYGGFANGDSWKLSSGIAGVKLEDESYIMSQNSGNIYRGHKRNYGMSGYSTSVLRSYQEEAEKSGILTIRLMEEAEAIRYLEDLRT